MGIALLFDLQNVASGRECVELIPWVTWFAASWRQLVFGAGIGFQWESESMLIWCGNYTREMDNELFNHLTDLMDCFDRL